MNIVFMSMDTLPSTLWARDLYDQMHIRSDFRKWFPRMCQYGFIEGRDYEYMPRVRLQDEGGRTVQRYVKDTASRRTWQRSSANCITRQSVRRTVRSRLIGMCCLACCIRSRRVEAAMKHS